MNSLLAICLSIQVALALLAPGVLFHGRTLFACDAWALLVIGVLGFYLARAKQLPGRGWWARLAAITVLMGVIFYHGKFRVEIAPVLIGRGFPEESDQFIFSHELVIMVRFVSWIAEGSLLWFLLSTINSPTRESLREKTGKSLAWITFISGILTILSGVSPSVAEALNGIYGYRDSAGVWGDRAFGPFRSPLEAGLTLSLCGFFVNSWRSAFGNKLLRVNSIVSAGIGMLFSRTATAFGSAVATLAVSRFMKQSARSKGIIVFLGLVLAGVIYFYAPDLGVEKWNHFTGRFPPWVLGWKALFSRADLLALGLGFNPLYIDNAYLLLLYKLGLIGAAVLGGLMLRWGWKNWANWSTAQREVLIFLLISGLTLDTFIIRPVVMVFIAAGLPLLAPRPQSCIQ